MAMTFEEAKQVLTSCITDQEYIKKVTDLLTKYELDGLTAKEAIAKILNGEK
jgi:hypothetical protein